jgi:aldehyde dehydrogenase (NAD+)
VELSRARYAQGFGPFDPWEPGATMGPLITGTQRDRVESAVARSLDLGAEVLAGGGRPDLGQGYFINPVLLGGVESGSEIAQEEVFGPVSVVLAYRSEEDAIRLANDTKFGLNASIIGKDVARCIQLASRIRSGTVMVNGGGVLRPDSLWGGMKQSGIGREYGELGISEYLETQHVLWSVGQQAPATLVPPT